MGNARLTAGTADGPERTGEARRQVRMVLYASALGQITREEREEILAILRPCCPEVFSFAPARDDPYAAPAFLDNADHDSAHATAYMA